MFLPFYFQALLTRNDTDTDTDNTKFWVAWLPVRVFILTEIWTEIWNEWVLQPFCQNFGPSPLPHC